MDKWYFLSENEATLPSLPIDIMEYIAAAVDGVLFSSLIGLPQFLSKYGDIDNLVANIHRLLALRLLEQKLEKDITLGDDYRLKLTTTGRKYLKQEHE